MRSGWCALLAVSVCQLAPPALAAQDNLLDLRVAELDRDGHRTYHNFIYSRTLASGKLLLGANLLLLPQIDYEELSAGAGVRALGSGGTALYLSGNLARASDDNYFEPSVLATASSGRMTAAFFSLLYVPLGSSGISQLLVDPAEVQIRVAGPVQVGPSVYWYRPAGGPAVSKVGAQLGLKAGAISPSLVVRQVSQGGGLQFQFRLVAAF